MSLVVKVFLVLFVTLTLPVTRKPLQRWINKFFWSTIPRQSGLTKKPILNPSRSNPTNLVSVSEAMQIHKNLYHQLHNLEKHPYVLTQARDLLISLFAEAVEKIQHATTKSILAIDRYEARALKRFLQDRDDEITLRWERYLARRKAEKPREMFKDREHAKWWLRQSAPVKYVDGAWLGHIHKVSTPFALRSTTKNAWQILSEELGDGDLIKNHVQIYKELMADIDHDLADADGHNFIEDNGLDAPEVWKAAVAQLLISLFPHEFLPEILGFNMHFEMLTWDTMRAIKELKELGFSNYYFLLHVSIDNADSGHTAMAMHTVVEYLRNIQETEGGWKTQQEWRRIQIGFLLSESLTCSPGCVSSGAEFSDGIHFNQYEVDIAQIFKAKALVAHRLHCSSQLKIKGRMLADWLEPGAFKSRRWQKHFINALAETEPWIFKGDGEKSRLVKEVCWNGKMFGSFTQTEVGALTRWIDSLAIQKPDPKHYWAFTSRTDIFSNGAPRNKDIRVNYPVFPPLPKVDSLFEGPAVTPDASIFIDSLPNLGGFFSLWFAQSCILEGLITIPFKTASPIISGIVRMLRVQYGFAPEGSGVAGMDETRRTHFVDLVEIGLEMMEKARICKPKGLQDVLQGEDSEFALSMLSLAMRPIEYKDALIGMAWACMGLHEALATSTSFDLLSLKTKAVLASMARRERLGLQICLDELQSDQARYAQFCKGLKMVRSEIVSLFS